MKKTLFFVITLLLAVLMLASCGGDDEPQYYMVEFNSNGGKDYQNRQYEAGDLISNPPVPTRAGFIFMGWYNGDNKWNFNEDAVTADVTLTARWERLTYTVRFDSKGGSSVESVTVNSGDKVARPTDPTKESAVFVGWFLDGIEWNFEISPVSDNITLIAKWDPASTYTVTFDSNGGTATDPQYIINGQKATTPRIPTKENSAFLGWFLGETMWDFDNDTVTNDITLVAKWDTIETYTVNFNSNGGSAIPAQHIPIGGKATKPPQPDRTQNGKFEGWYNGSTKWDFDTVVTENITLTAKWTNIYTVTFDTNGAQETIESILVYEGKFLTKPADPTKQNSKFAGWYNGNAEWNFDTDKVTSDLNLIAKWNPVPTYTVTFDSNGGTPVTEQHVLEGGYITDPGSSKDGYRLEGWYYTDDDDEVRWNFIKDTVESPITLKAKWIETVNVILNVDGEETINATDKGQVFAKPADPKKDGYVFIGWFIDGQDTPYDFSLAVSTPLTLNARFLVACTVTFDSDGGTAVAPITVGMGQTIAKPLVSRVHHRFTGWCISGTSIKWNFNDPVTENIVLKATWVPTLPVDEWVTD